MPINESTITAKSTNEINENEPFKLYRYSNGRDRPEISSTRKRRCGMPFLQYLHLPRKRMNEISGIKSKAFSVFLQCSQYDRPFIKDLPVDSLSINTLRKLPRVTPIMKSRIIWKRKGLFKEAIILRTSSKLRLDRFHQDMLR